MFEVRSCDGFQYKDWFPGMLRGGVW